MFNLCNDAGFHEALVRDAGQPLRAKEKWLINKDLAALDQVARDEEKNQEKQGRWHIKRKWIQYQSVKRGLGEIDDVLKNFWKNDSFYDYAMKVKHEVLLYLKNRTTTDKKLTWLIILRINVLLE